MSMNPRSLVLILVALVAAGGTAMVARNWLMSERSQSVATQTATKVSETNVLVAAVNLPSGHIIGPDDLKWQPWPEDGLSEFFVVQGAESSADFSTAVVRRGIAAGTPVTRDQVVKPGERGFLAAVLTPGMRAVSVSVSATSGIAGFVFPGDRVDLILTQELASSAGKRHASETVLTNVRVLAVDQKTNDQENAPTIAKTATLEVTPKQAEKIAVLRTLGSVSLSLRSLANLNQVDENTDLTPAMPEAGKTHTWDSEVSRLLTSAGGPGSSRQIIVVRGNEVSSVKFGSGSK